MTEEQIKIAVQDVKAFMKKVFPDQQTFLEFARPYFLPIRTEYENYLSILKKIGVENIETVVQYVVVFPKESLFTDIDSIIEKAGREMYQILEGENLNEISALELYKKAEKKISFANMLPHFAGAYENMHIEHDKKYKELNEKINTLPEQDQITIEYFNFLLLKLYLCYIFQDVTFSSIIPKTYMKQFIVGYLDSMNKLYGKEVIPKLMLDHLESIKIPDEEKLLAEFSKPLLNNTHIIPITIIEQPIFHQPEEIFTELKKHFTEQQHQQLNHLLTGKTIKQKLLFLGKGNQLADAFKKLHNAQFITGCTKEVLISWVYNNFQYRDKNKNIDYKKNYLHDIISSDTKPCKSPIIEISEGGNGIKIITSSLKASRKK
jgi:hypothetical protein